MANHTLTFSESAKGFPSFYSFIPEYMIGMNNYLYSFNNGQLYRHNTNETRNEYYGVTSPSVIKTIINENPLDNKLFKTIGLESTDAWSVNILTDIAAQDSTINSTTFEKKEGNWFAYIRTDGVDSTGPVLTESDYKSRTIGGIGVSNQIIPSANSVQMIFQLQPNLALNIGDYIYYVPSGDDEATYCGRVSLTFFDKINTQTVITVDTTIGSGTNPSVGDFVLFAKNSQAESLGLMGHYAEVTLTLPTSVTTASELYAIESELMRSYP
jgi:hypothetical protein